MNAHVSNIARTCYFELRRLASIRRFLTSTATAILVSAFVSSRIDYCSSLLFGSTHDVTSHLQGIQNYAARLICNSSTAPSYIANMLHKKPSHTSNTRCSSYTTPLFNRPAHSKATIDNRSFSFASSSVWNSIPYDVRCIPSLSSFKSRLKIYFFRSVYKD